MDNVSFKTCPKCLTSRPTTDYHKDRSRKDGLGYYCVVCNKAYKRKPDPSRYYRHREDNIKRQLLYRSLPETRLSGLLLQAKRRSTARSMPYDLDLQWAIDHYNNQNGSCLLTGIPFVLESNPTYNRKRNNPYAVSIDRIDSDKGYTKDNCRLVCVIVNVGLNRFGDDVFEHMCQCYLEHKGRKVV